MLTLLLRVARVNARREGLAGLFPWNRGRHVSEWTFAPPAEWLREFGRFAAVGAVRDAHVLYAAGVRP